MFYHLSTAYFHCPLPIFIFLHLISIEFCHVLSNSFASSLPSGNVAAPMLYSNASLHCDTPVTVIADSSTNRSMRLRTFRERSLSRSTSSSSSCSLSLSSMFTQRLPFLVLLKVRLPLLLLDGTPSTREASSNEAYTPQLRIRKNSDKNQMQCKGIVNYLTDMNMTYQLSRTKPQFPFGLLRTTYVGTSLPPTVIRIYAPSGLAGKSKGR